jgi:hypothetical protein
MRFMNFLSDFALVLYHSDLSVGRIIFRLVAGWQAV